MGLLFILNLGDWIGRQKILRDSSTYFQLANFSKQPEWRINVSPPTLKAEIMHRVIVIIP